MIPIEEMSIDEYISWATGTVIMGLGSPKETLRDSIYKCFIVFIAQWLPSHGWVHYTPEELKEIKKKGGRKK